MTPLEITALLGSVTTVVAFVAFIGICVWAWSRRRAAAFAAAANAPFAIPDETDEIEAPSSGTAATSPTPGARTNP